VPPLLLKLITNPFQILVVLTLDIHSQNDPIQGSYPTHNNLPLICMYKVHFTAYLFSSTRWGVQTFPCFADDQLSSKMSLRYLQLVAT